MNFDDIDKLTASKEEADRLKKEKRAEQAALLQCYSRLFKTDDGQKVLNDLSKRYLYDNGILLDSNNIDYRAAFANGESEVVKQIIKKIQSAEVV